MFFTEREKPGEKPIYIRFSVKPRLFGEKPFPRV
jgi:hypothetical protein